jgi:hypothetical protein
MPECHKCRHNGKRRKVCLRCPGPSTKLYNSGQTIVSMEAKQGDEHDVLLFQAEQYDALAHVLNAWLRLDRKTARLLRFYLLSPEAGITALAQRVGISQQAVHERLKKARRDWPALKFVIPMKLLDEGNRKPAVSRE